MYQVINKREYQGEKFLEVVQVKNGLAGPVRYAVPVKSLDGFQLGDSIEVSVKVVKEEEKNV